MRGTSGCNIWDNIIIICVNYYLSNGNEESLILPKIGQVWNMSLKQNDKYPAAKIFWSFTLNDKNPNKPIQNMFSAISLFISKI